MISFLFGLLVLVGLVGGVLFLWGKVKGGCGCKEMT